MTVPAVTGPYQLIAVLLAAAGIAKLRAPQQALAAWRAVPLPGGSTALVRAGAAFEVVLAVAALTSGARGVAVLVAILYAAFAVGIGQLLHRGEREISCGCFGVAATPIRPLHVAVDAVCALVAAWAAVAPGGPPTLQGAIDDGGALTAALVLATALAGAYATALIFTRLPLQTLEVTDP